MTETSLRAFAMTLVAMCYIITLGVVLAYCKVYNETIANLLSRAVGGILGYSVAPRLAARRSVKP